MEDQYSTFLSRRCADWVDYSHAAPFQREKPGFRVKVENGKARLELDQRYATVEEARKAVEDYVLAWNVSACCTLGPDFSDWNSRKRYSHPVRNRFVSAPKPS